MNDKSQLLQEIAKLSPTELAKLGGSPALSQIAKLSPSDLKNLRDGALLDGLNKLSPTELAQVQVTVARQRGHAMAKSADASATGRGWSTWGKPFAAR